MPPTSHALEDFGDPESDDWVPPPTPREADLPDNTKTWGPFYRWTGPATQRCVVAPCITREIHPPWHFGVGIGIRWDRPDEPYAYVVGVWWRSKPPRILNTEPAERDLLTVIDRANHLDKLSADI